MTPGHPIFTHAPVAGARGAVAAGHAAAAEAGIAMIAAGGTAVDALVAAAFASFVVEPAACGLGGYVHVSIWSQRARRFLTIDAYGRAPAAAHATMFEPEEAGPATYYGHPFTRGNRAMSGALAPAVPGAAAGLCAAHRLGGALPLPEVLAPAIALAEAGHDLTWIDSLSVARCSAEGLLAPCAAAVLMPAGRVPAVSWATGTAGRLDTSALARVLREIAAKGAAGFHGGWVAEAIGRHVAASGGILTAADIAGYRPRLLEETPQTYRGAEYIACFDQVAYEALNILEGFDLAALDPAGAPRHHLVAEALGIAFADSMTHYGDPEHVAAPIAGLSSKNFAAARRALMDPARALPRPIAAGDPWAHEGNAPAFRPLTGEGSPARRDGTSQAAAADRHGNVASICMSLGSSYGAGMFVAEAGLFLNNAMQNFDPRPGRPNSIAPGKMPIFAAPALAVARGGEGTFAASGSGGYRIEAGVLQTFLNHADHGLPLQQAVDQPRVHCQGGETVLDARIPPEAARQLAAMGHTIRREAERPGSWPFGRVNAVARDPATGEITAGAGPSWQTAVAAC